MATDLTARLREIADETLGEVDCSDVGVVDHRRKAIHAALLAAVRLGMEEAESIEVLIPLYNPGLSGFAQQELAIKAYRAAIRAAMPEDAI